ncbi:MAG: hypothetical protein M0Z71_10825 [Nitrospiraceae bacterium]|nr:hypothetical protein [Nitrospiraceae bacterium]MDA8433708.1 hypothetical protein [Nitrospiraceae bacterium]
MKKIVFLIVSFILAIFLAGCGGGDNGVVVVPNVVRISSDQVFDGDITSDAATGNLSAPTFADVSQNVLSGIVFDPVTDAEISETRGFLHFTLSGTGVPRDAARITLAKISVVVSSVTPVATDSFAEIPFFIDLIDTSLYPAPIVSSDFDASPVSSMTTFYRGADAGTLVEIDITSLLQDALDRGLNDFEVRLRFDRTRFQTDLTTIRGLVDIDDANDAPGHQRIDFAPLLHVEFL